MKYLLEQVFVFVDRAGAGCAVAAFLDDGAVVVVGAVRVVEGHP